MHIDSIISYRTPTINLINIYRPISPDTESLRDIHEIPNTIQKRTYTY